MKNYRVTGIAGDGIGAEIMESVVKVVEGTDIRIEWEWMEAGEAALKKYGEVVSQRVIDSIKKNKVALKGPITTPIGEGFKSANVTLRRALDLFAQVRPVKNIPGIRTRYDDVDIIVVRENTEGLYSGLEHEVIPGIAQSFKVVSSSASKRIAQYAFDLARREGRKKVTALHKANILKLTDGLFLRCVREEAAAHKNVVYEEMLVDNASMRLVLDPKRFDIILADNFIGDIISEECAGLVGGAGLVPGYNIGSEAVMFEALHGSAPDIAGKGVANPTALILSAALMLKHMGEVEGARQIEQAVNQTFERGESLTRDLGGEATTLEFTGAVVSELKALKKAA